MLLFSIEQMHASKSKFLCLPTVMFVLPPVYSKYLSPEDRRQCATLKLHCGFYLDYCLTYVTYCSRLSNQAYHMKHQYIKR